MPDLKNSLAFCIRKFLTKVLTPLTGFIQRQNLSDEELLLPWGKIKHHVIYWISSRCGGMITFAYPEIPYHPIETHRQENKREWASALLDIPSDQLKKISTEFLIKTQYYLISEILTSSALPTFTILVCFHHHLHYFKKCLTSIQEAIRCSPSSQIEILLIHDDPSIDLLPHLADLEDSFRQKFTIHTHSENQGICNSLNEGILYAQGEWLIHLDCDDLLEPTIFPVLEKTIREHPHIRFISSRAADIDIDEDVLFWRLRSEHSYELIKDNFAGHLKVVKKELYHEFGLFKKTFEGCQDYEFALRTAINEPLLFIPNYLYRYRWHHDTQTVSQNERQNLTAMRVRQTYLLVIYWLTHGTKMIQWNITGPESASWKESLCSQQSDQSSCEVTLEATTPYSEQRWKLLLVKVATTLIDRYREKDKNTSLFLKV